MTTHHISESEAIIMHVLWQDAPQTSEAIIHALKEQQPWQEPTIKTLINRLLKKGAIKAEKDGRRYLYSPVLTYEAWASSESESLLNRVFDGRIAPLVAHFSQQQKLSAADIDELKALINKLDS